MKTIPFVKILLAAFTVSLLANTPLFAQENVIKLNIFSPILKTLNMSYERVLNPNSSLQLGFYYTGAKSGDVQLSGFGITPEYRFFLSDTPAPDGVYIAPWVRYQNLDADNPVENASGRLTSFGGGVVIGRQWVFKNIVTLDIFIGPQYLSATVDPDQGSEEAIEVTSASGFWFRAGLNLGIAF